MRAAEVETTVVAPGAQAPTVASVRHCAGKVTGRVHQPADATHGESWELFVEGEGDGDYRRLQVNEATFDWARMGAVVWCDQQGHVMRIEECRFFAVGETTWQP